MCRTAIAILLAFSSLAASGGTAAAQDIDEMFWDEMGNQVGAGAQAWSDYWAERQLWQDKAAAARAELERCGGCASAQAELDKWTGIERQFQDTAGSILAATGQSPLVGLLLGIGEPPPPREYVPLPETPEFGGLRPDLSYVGEFSGETQNLNSYQITSRYTCTVVEQMGGNHRFDCINQEKRRKIRANGRVTDAGFVVDWGDMKVTYVGQPAVGGAIWGYGEFRGVQLKLTLKKLRDEKSGDAVTGASASGAETKLLVVPPGGPPVKVPQAQLAPEPTSPSAVLPNGVWEGTYVCGQGKTGARFTMTSNDGKNVIARFRFFEVPENPGVPLGEIEMAGPFVPDTGQFFLSATRWIIEPPGYMTVGMDGRMDMGTGQLTGRLKAGGCQEFTLVRQPAG